MVELRITSIILALAALAVLFWALPTGSSVTSVHAQSPDTPTPDPIPVQIDDAGVRNLPLTNGKLNPPKYPKMDSNLNRIIEQAQTGQFTARSAAAKAPIHRGESVAVTLDITEGYVQDVWDWLERGGASPRNSGVDYIEAYISVSLLPAASEREGVLSIRTVTPAEPAQGMVVSEGVGLHGAAAWHDVGLKGKGVKIGIIDAGFEGFPSLMGTELPSNVKARCYTDVGVFTSSIADCENWYEHGTAVTEAVFDMAPAATYYIASPLSRGDLSSTVDWMVSQEVDVINYSMNRLWEGPGDGTSPYSYSDLKSVDTAVTGGITWINGAGNLVRKNWFGDFTDANNDDWHEFSGADNCNAIQLYRPFRYVFQLRWDDSWGGASKDLDLALYQVDSSSSLTLEESSTDLQSGGDDQVPFESIKYNPPPSSSGEYCLAVLKKKGPTPDWIQMQKFSGPWGDLEHYTPSGSIGTPAESANPGLLAVGAAPVSDTSTIEPSSSRGPTPDGRVKPDIVGVAGANSKIWGRWDATSQSSPHVAGLAALVKQRFPTYTPQQVAQYLKTNAEERGEAGADNTWGHGFARLPAADAEVQSLTGPVTGLTATATHNTVSLKWKAPSFGATVTGYKILRRAVDTEQDFTALSEDTGDTGTAWTDSDVSARTRYAYRVRALGENGEGDLSSYASVVTDFVPLPGRVTGLTASATHDTVSLSWDAPSDGEEVTGYKILRRAVDTEQDFTALSEDTGDTSNTWMDGSVSARTRYSYRVRALGENGEGDLSNLAKVVTDLVPLPGRVTGLTATATHDTVSLSWDAPSDGATVTGYKILRRAVDSESDFQVLSENTGDTSNTWMDGDVSPRTRYSYRVRALGENGEGDLSNLASVITDFAPLPGRVTGLTATATHDTVSLSWNAPSDGATVTGYKILRRAVQSESGFTALSENTGNTSATWTDSDVSARTRYAYRVRALGENGEGDLSNLAKVITDFAPPPRVENSSATGSPTITGTAQVGETLTADTSGISDADGLDDATFSYQWIADGVDISGATDSTYTLTDADEDKSVKVCVSFTDDAGNDETLTSAATAAVSRQPAEPLTASLENEFTHHDGLSPFTFELRFSEEVKLSYKTLRDHAFTVTGGTVVKAKRLDQSSNIRWRITVRPDSIALVTVLLPVTTDCETQSAICTEDGKKLSNSLTLTVTGPG